MKKILLILFLLISNIAFSKAYNVPSNCVYGRAKGYSTWKEAYAAAELDAYINVAKEIYGDENNDDVRSIIHKQLGYNNPSYENISNYRKRVFLTGIREVKFECGYDDDSGKTFMCTVVLAYPTKDTNVYEIIHDTMKYQNYQDLSKGYDASNPDQFKKPEDDSIWKKLDYNF